MGTITVFAFIITVILAFAIGKATIRNPEREAMVLERHSMIVERQRAVLPYKILSEITGLVVFGIALKVGAFVLGGYGLYYILRLFLNWLDLRGRQVHAQAGVFPLIRLDSGTLYDANRAVGDDPFITLAALNVQRTSAIRADKITIKQAAQLPQLPQAGALPAPVQWPTRIPLRGLLDGPSSLNNLVLGVTLGEQGQSEVVRGAMAELVHIAVGGSSGWGKSVFLQMLTYQLCMAIEKLDLCMIDLEGVTLNSFANSDRLLYPIADNEQDAVGVLQALNNEMSIRKELFNQHPGIDRLDKYNAVTSEPLRPIIAVIDEVTALLSDKRVEEHLRDLTLRSRKYGLWLIMAGQSWKASNLDSTIKNQLSTRVQFKSLNSAQSRVLLGKGDAKDISHVGRAYAILPGRSMIEMQAPFVNSDMIISAVSGNGAQQKIPAAIPQQDTQEERIFDLLSNGDLTDSKIAREVFGYSNGRTVEQVQNVRRRRQI